MGAAVIEDARLGEQVEALVATAEGGAKIQSLSRLSGGMSREAWAVDIAVQRGTQWEQHHCVMIRGADAGLIENGLEGEAALLSSLEPYDLPVPRIMWSDIAGSRLDRPAVIMQRIAGTAEPRGLKELDAATCSRIEAQYVEFLAKLHALPLHALPLETVPPDQVARRQVARWSDLVAAADLAAFPALAEIVRWLEDRAPVAARVCLVHGDYRYGNFLFDDSGMTGVLDWELAHAGDPVEDLVWAYRPFRRGTAPQKPLRVLVDEYQEWSGATVPWSTVCYYRIFSELKTAVIYLTGIHARESAAVADLGPWIPSQLISCCLRQALYWIDELEPLPC